MIAAATGLALLASAGAYVATAQADGPVSINRVNATTVGTFTAKFLQRTVSAQAKNRYYTTVYTTTGIPRTVFTLSQADLATAAKINVTMKSAKPTPASPNWAYTIIRARHMPG